MKDNMRKGKVMSIGSDTPRTDPTKVIADLIALAQALQFALDDAEEVEEGRHLIDAEHITNLLAVIERLDALPDDKPGYTMDFPGKAQWALRDLARLTEENEALRKDAARYEWLKAWNKTDGFSDEAIDREIAIDAAIKEGS